MAAIAAMAMIRSGPTRAEEPHTSNPLAKGKFLVASRQLQDPNFAETVLLLLDYGPDGAIGLIINHPSDVKLAKALPDIEDMRRRPDLIYLGGPVNRGQILLLVRATTVPAQSQTIFGSVHVTGSLSTLKQLMQDKTAGTKFHAYAGYAGWAPGQLDHEYARGDWHVIAADVESIFDTPSKDVWRRLIDRSAGRWVRGGTGELDGWFQLSRMLSATPDRVVAEGPHTSSRHLESDIAVPKRLLAHTRLHLPTALVPPCGVLVNVGISRSRLRVSPIPFDVSRSSTSPRLAAPWETDCAICG